MVEEITNQLAEHNSAESTGASDQAGDRADNILWKEVYLNE